VNLVQKNLIKDARLRESTGAYIPFVVQTKPHGHGDVHALLHSSGLLPKWYCTLTMLELHVITCS
jgi:UDP-N-acetylglucosamine pyrophosphorylase